jgi:two-component system sensor histidine kinase TctE
MKTGEHHPAGGLFIQLVDWMLAPLVIVWPTVVIVSYYATMQLADGPFDRELRSIVLAVAQEAQHPGAGDDDGDRYPALAALRAAPGERFLVQIADPAGRVVAGDSGIPPASAGGEGPAGEVTFREDYAEGERVRIGQVRLPPEGSNADGFVQVAEPLSRRRALASGVTNVVIVVMIVLIPVMVGLVWFGLYRGLLPLRQLSARIRSRDAEDLSPIPVEDAPEELAPLIESLNDQAGRIERNLEAQRRFVGDAAHQLRTPLAGLKSQAQIALREWPDAAVRQRLGRIEESAEQMGRLATQLLTLARADDLRNRLKASAGVDLDALVREVCGRAADDALARHVSLGFEASKAGAEVRGEPDLLRELFANLVDNALRYSPAGTEVTVRVASGPPAEVAVDDRGPGIAPQERDLVFGRFYRVLGTGVSGSGLGLAIVKTIADLHGASVRIVERAGGGTSFVVTFPVPDRR